MNRQRHDPLITIGGRARTFYNSVLANLQRQHNIAAGKYQAHRIGPGRRSVLTMHNKIAKGSRYMPHQGKQERARRIEQFSLEIWRRAQAAKELT